MISYKRVKFNKSESQRIHLENFLIKYIPVVASIFLLVSLGFNFYVFNNHKLSQYWYIFFILSVLYICYFGLISIFFFLGLSESFKLLMNNILYRQIIKFWIYKHIYTSDNLVEKKYKVLFLHLWFLHEGIYLNANIPKYYFWKKIIERTDKELYKNQINAELTLLYQRNEEKDFYYYFNKDINNMETANIIKRIYEDYECCAIATKKIFTYNPIHEKDAESILIIKDYLLTSADIEFIKLISKKIDSFSYFGISLNTEIFNEMVNKEDRLDILLLLKEVLNKLKGNVHMLHIGTILVHNQKKSCGDYKVNIFLKIIDTKIEYLTIKSELGNTNIKKKVNKV